MVPALLVTTSVTLVGARLTGAVAAGNTAAADHNHIVRGIALKSRVAGSHEAFHRHRGRVRARIGQLGHTGIPGGIPETDEIDQRLPGVLLAVARDVIRIGAGHRMHDPTGPHGSPQSLHDPVAFTANGRLRAANQRRPPGAPRPSFHAAHQVQ